MEQDELEDEVELPDSQLERVIYNPMTNLTRFKSLWIISFAYVNQLPDLTPLGDFACLGFVDLSYTKVNLKQLQQAFSRTHLIRLNILETPAFKIQNATGFLINTLHVWILNGVYISFLDRQKWHEFFVANPYSTTQRKWKFDDTMFVPTRLKHPGKACSRKWTRHAKYWLNIPNTFTMAAEYDNFKLKRLSDSMGTYLEDAGVKFNFEMLQAHDDVTLFLLVASFLKYPHKLLHSTMRIFHQDSPLNWPFKDRLSFLGLLIGKVKMDSNSILKGGFKVSHSILDFIQKLIARIVFSLYPTSTNTKDFDFDQQMSVVGYEQKLTRDLDQSDQEKFALLNLQIIELLCINTNYGLFLDQFDELYQIYKKNLEILGFEPVEISRSNGLSLIAKATEVQIAIILSVRGSIQNYHFGDAKLDDAVEHS